MEQSSEEGLARLARELRAKLEATQPAAYCSQGIAAVVGRDVAQRLYEIASSALQRFDVVGTTEHMRNLCKNIAARFHIRVPLLPSEEHHSHKIHSPHCMGNGGTVNCTDLGVAPLLELEADAARDELGPDLKLWREAFAMQRQQADALDSGAYMQALLRDHAMEQRRRQREAVAPVQAAVQPLVQAAVVVREPGVDDGLSGEVVAWEN